MLRAERDKAVEVSTVLVFRARALLPPHNVTKVATPQYDKGKGDENEGNNHLFEDDAVVVIMILGKGRSQELFDK